MARNRSPITAAMNEFRDMSAEQLRRQAAEWREELARNPGGWLTQAAINSLEWMADQRERRDHVAR